MNEQIRTLWVRQKNIELDDVYCPIDIKKQVVYVGLSYIGKPEGKIIGEFWFENGDLKVQLYDENEVVGRGATK